MSPRVPANWPGRADLLLFPSAPMSTIEEFDRRIAAELARGELPRHSPTEIAQQMAEINRRHARFQQTAERLLAGVIRPRMQKLAGHFANAKLLDPPDPLLAQTVTPAQIARLRDAIANTPPDERARARADWDKTARNILRLHRAGVKIGIGSDGGGQGRDRYIGWSAEARRQNIRFIAYNTKFLILPWVRVPHLASHILGRMAAVLSDDWQRMYCHPVYFAETFIDPGRFRGTCYRAANWQLLGRTTGRGKDDQTKKPNRPIKEVLGLPLTPRFRELLNQL